MITKKELVHRYSITLSTVRKTLEACGLDTSRAEYTQEEIVEKFDPARTMLVDERKSYTEVAAHFGTVFNDQSYDTEPEIENGSQAKARTTATDPLSEAVQKNVNEYVQEVTDEAVLDAINHLPEMIQTSIKKAVKSGAVDDVFQQLKERRRQFRDDGVYEVETIDVPLGGLPFDTDDDKGEE